MKKYLIIMLTAVGAFSLTCCDNKLGTDQVDAGYISIRASIGQMTKVSYNGNATSFTEGDTILLYGWTGGADEVPAQRVVDSVTNWFDGTVWTPDKQMRWKNATDAHYFLGIYPVPDSVTSFTAASYKLDVADYKASDLLVAANLGGIKATDGPVNLTFNHVMAKLNVNLKFPSEWDSVPVVNTVTATVKTTATVNYLTGTMTANGIEEALPMSQDTITAAGYDYSFSCLEIPQTDAKYITITVGARRFVYEASKNIPLNSGKLTTIDLKVGKDTIFLNTISVSEWEAAADLHGGLAELDPYNGHEYVDMGNGLKWATCNVGATKPEEYGDYFAWGDTVPNYVTLKPLEWREGKTGFNWASYWDNPSGDGETFDKYALNKKTVLDIEDDAARYNWGGTWRTPTDAEWKWLCDSCSWTFADDYNGTGINGMIVTSNISGFENSSIFLPATGIWTPSGYEKGGIEGFYQYNSLRYTGSYYAKYLSIGQYGLESAGVYRRCGLSIRPVSN